MIKSYEKPVIARQHGGITNKFGGGSFKSHYQDTIEGHSIRELMEQYGSPLFVYSERQLKKQHRAMMDAFTLRYPRVHHGWSYKTNYLKAICESFHRLGAWAEVVSEMEYDMAKSLKVPANHIIFNGPLKPYRALKRALGEGALVNVDSLDELYDIEKIAAETGRTAQVGIRVNMSLGIHAAWDRFGFNIESGAAIAAVRRAKASGKIAIVGLHCHIGTFVYEPTLYTNAMKELIAFSKVIQQEYGAKIQYIDIGGGFASKNRLKGTYLSTADMIPSFESYAEAICTPLLDAFLPEDLPTLFLESGRGVIDEAGMLLATVVAVKRLNTGTRSLVVDAGVNLLFTGFWYDHDVIPTVDRGAAVEDHVIYGPLCMQIDVVRPQVRLPALEKGDSILIRPVGAYNNTQWMQFITLRPNVVMISEEGKVSLIREAETTEYLQRLEHFPEWFPKAQG